MTDSPFGDGNRDDILTGMETERRVWPREKRSANQQPSSCVPEYGQVENILIAIGTVCIFSARALQGWRNKW